MNMDSSTVQFGFMSRCDAFPHTTTMNESPPEATRYEHDGIVMDRLRRKVTVGGIPLELTVREFALLEMFLAQRSQVLARERIAEAIWESPVQLETNLIDVYVLRLRKKLGPSTIGHPRIHTVRGVGYMLD